MDKEQRNRLYGSNRTCPRGRLVEQFMQDKNLDVCNIGNEPTYISGKNQSTIDITLVSAEYSHLIRNWTVSNDHNHSDHRTITFEIESLQPEVTYRLNTKKMNMEGFKKDVEEDIKKLQVPNKWDLDTMTIGQNTSQPP